MRTVPATISTGLTNNLRAFWLLKIEGSASTLYWTTASKNFTGQTMTLKDATVTKTYDSSIIAKEIDGEEMTGLGPVEYSVDISQGGTVAGVSGLTVDCLNQDRLDAILRAAGNILEYRAVTLYFGFIPAGLSPTVEITTDMLSRWTGVVEDVQNYDYGHFAIECIDGAFQRSKLLPSRTIESGQFTNAPKESIGKTIPLIYGNLVPDDEQMERDFARLCPAPTILVDKSRQYYLVTDHTCSLSETYIIDKSLSIYGLVRGSLYSSKPSLVSAYSASCVPLSGSSAQRVLFLQPLKKSAGANNVADFSNIIDSSPDSYNTLTGSDLLILKADTISMGVDFSINPLQIYLIVRYGTVSGSGGVYRYYNPSGGSTSLSVGFVAGDSNTRINISLAGAAFTESELGQYSFGLDMLSAPNVQMKLMAIAYEYSITNYVPQSGRTYYSRYSNSALGGRRS